MLAVIRIRHTGGVDEKDVVVARLLISAGERADHHARLWWR